MRPPKTVLENFKLCRANLFLMYKRNEGLVDTLRDLLTSPPDVIARAKRERCLCRTGAVLVVDWILIATAILALSLRWMSLGWAAGMAAGIFILGVLATAFLGWLIRLIMTLLGGRGDYFEGLTSVTYAIFPLSLGILLSVAISPLALLSGLIIFALLTVLSLLGLATLYRAVKELFGTDLITVWIALSILMGVLISAFYAALLIAQPELLAWFGTERALLP
jgi:hypothetical protein